MAEMTSGPVECDPCMKLWSKCLSYSVGYLRGTFCVDIPEYTGLIHVTFDTFFKFESELESKPRFILEKDLDECTLDDDWTKVKTPYFWCWTFADQQIYFKTFNELVNTIHLLHLPGN